MALEVSRGFFDVPASTGTQSVAYPSPLGSTPSAFILFGNQIAASGVASSVSFNLGFDDASSNHYGTAMGSGPGFGATRPEAGWSDVHSMVSVRQTFAFELQLAGSITSANTSGFTVNWGTNSGRQNQRWYYTTIGGSGISTKVGAITTISSTGNVVISTGSFKPVAVILQYHPGATGGSLFGPTSRAPSFGWATECNTVTRGLATWMESANPSVCKRDQTDALIAIDSSSEVFKATVSAWGATSFTLNITTAIGIGYLSYCAIGGCAANAGVFNQPTSIGSQSVSVAATQPKYVFFASANAVTASGVNANSATTFGTSDGVTTGSVYWGYQDNASDPGKMQADIAETSLVYETPTGFNAATISARSAVTSLAPSQINLNWSVADSTARETFYLLLADTAGGTSCGSAATNSITVSKSTDIATSAVFPFTTSGGLSPSTFNLNSGDSRVYTGLSAGTYGITETVPTGWSAEYTVSNGNPHNAIVLGGGDAVTVAVANSFSTTTSQLRRYRRFNLPYSANYNVFLKRVELIAQMGVGTSVLDPTFTLNFSKDGGQTYPITRTVTLGLSGDYTKRAYCLQLGEARNWVCEMYCDDPVFTGLIAFDVDAESGIS